MVRRGFLDIYPAMPLTLLNVPSQKQKSPLLRGRTTQLERKSFRLEFSWALLCFKATRRSERLADEIDLS